MGKKKKRKVTKLDPKEKALRIAQRRFRTQISSVFKSAGFKSVSTRNTEITFKEKKGELDGVFVFENVVVLTEDTCSKTSDQIRDHLLKKDQFYKLLIANKDEFIELLEKAYPGFKAARGDYQPASIKLVIVYCTKNRLEDLHKKSFPHIVIMGDRQVQYFSTLVKTLKKSARFELFKFLCLKTSDIGLMAGESDLTYSGFILPETPSGFPSGHKVVTFYIDPERLLHLSYVLRKDGWEDSENLYQRMISRSKIKSMRKFLGQEDKVFINNVIVSLPASTNILDPTDKKQINRRDIVQTTSIKVQVPNQFNTIGIIDGQHRVFAYHEGSDDFEKQIAPKRKRQQLLVTGVVYPETVSDEKQREFEAKLFLEINDKQTKTRADLRQAIEAMVNPFSIIALSRAIINKLAANGPLCGYLEEHQFDRGKLKSSSIVSYGLRHIVKCEGDDTLFNLWKHKHKKAFAAAVKAASSGKKKFAKPAKSVLDHYVQFCAGQINNILIGYKLGVLGISDDLWTLDRKRSRAVNATAINGVIFCLRKLLQEKTPMDLDEYKVAFKKLKINFTPLGFKYKSSHWVALGEEIFKQCFGS
jgi:DGQHR domain-containing protein